MNEFVTKCRLKFSKWSFRFFYAKKLRLLGKGAHVYSPFRFDGIKNIEIGEGTYVQRGVWFYCLGIEGTSASLKIGKRCAIGYNNHIAAVRNVVIGDNVLTANNVYISDNLHNYEDIKIPIMDQPVRFKREVSIGDGCWIGENAAIIGVQIGKNCVIGANAVVTSDIPDYSVAVGVPAVIIKKFDVELQKWIKVGS